MMETLSTRYTDAPTAKITRRTAEGKEKTVEYNAGCGVQEMQQSRRQPARNPSPTSTTSSGPRKNSTPAAAGRL